MQNEIVFKHATLLKYQTFVEFKVYTIVSNNNYFGQSKSPACQQNKFNVFSHKKIKVSLSKCVRRFSSVETILIVIRSLLSSVDVKRISHRTQYFEIFEILLPEFSIIQCA